MAADPVVEDLKDRLARQISSNRIKRGRGDLGTLTIKLQPFAVRTFTAHWTGYKIQYPNRTLVLEARLHDGTFWAEGYISELQPSWVLTFRSKPHKTRGSGSTRPDDDLAPPQPQEVDAKRREQWREAGLLTREELIRMEDISDPGEAIDAFFNYTALYVLKAVNATWEAFGYEADPSIGWQEDEVAVASLPIEAAIDEGLKKSDILWVTLNSDPQKRPVPCWFIYTKDKRLYVLSGEPEQTLNGARTARDAHVVTRWKGRDARLAEFDAKVRQITPAEPDEFSQVGQLLVAKRQSVTGTAEENIRRWMKEGVILELIPRA